MECFMSFRRIAPLTAACLAAFSMSAFAAPLDPAKVKAVVDAQVPAYLQDHKAITEIESPTGDKAGSRQMADWLKARFEPLGYKAEYRENDGGTHVILRKKGEGQQRVLILGHTDTVQPKGSLAKKPYSYDAKTCLSQGPGAGDSKASVAQLLHFAQAMEKLGYKNYGEMIFYFDAEEEVGSDLEEKILDELAKQADLTLSVDTARPGWGLTTQRKWAANFDISVKGTTGHAGNSPQSSASATVELANQITRIMKLASPLPKDPSQFTPAGLAKRGLVDHGQFIPELTINVGVIETSNTKRNSVPAAATAKLDIRGYKAEDLKKIQAAIAKIAATPVVGGTKVEVKGPFGFLPAMEKTPAAARLVESYKKIVKQQYGANVVEWSGGGVTIGNFTAKHIPTIDGLGVETDYEHDLDKETVDLKTFAPRTVSMILLLDEVAAQGLKAK
jgi:glutamate carboxypeptidase